MQLVPIPMEGSPALPAARLSAHAQELIRGNQDFYLKTGFHPPWIAYVATLDEGVVGVCAFKGPPKDGVVEIAYGTMSGWEGQGIATRMAAQLVFIARSTDASVRIIAQTLPEPNASTSVLTKLGFTRTGEAVDDEVGRVWEWELTGPAA